VVITRRLERSGVQFVVIRQPDSSLACLPVWMTQEAASHFKISDKPRFSLDILRSLRTEVDALLGFLLSESKMEEADNDEPSLFEEDTARIDLAAEQKANLAPLVEALLREIATALAKGESNHDQDHD
jgi:hypothetical protein